MTFLSSAPRAILTKTNKRHCEERSSHYIFIRGGVTKQPYSAHKIARNDGRSFQPAKTMRALTTHRTPHPAHNT